MNHLRCLGARKLFRFCGFLLAAIALTPAVAFGGVNGRTIYAATNGGVFKTDSSGGEWAAVGPPVSNARTDSVAIDPAAPSTVYAGTAGELFKSTDGGASWNGSRQAAWIYSLVFSPQTPSTIDRKSVV